MSHWKFPRPKFAGRAAFKTLLKRNGWNVPRNFYGLRCCVVRKGNHFYRFRFSAGLVDVSCHWKDFDRWANSTQGTVDIEAFKAGLRNRGTAS